MDTERRAALRSVVACNVGVALEGFDFIVYGALSPYLAASFFPTGNAVSATLLTLATFGVAYVVRPVGGVLWGRYADRHGRRVALVWISFAMAFGMTVIAATPSYASIGLAAPVLVVLARLVQGLAHGGEFGSATAMLVELAPGNRRGLYASTQMAVQGLTVALTSAAVVVLTLALSPAAVQGWGWRLVFAVGVLIGPVGVYMRRRMAESPEFLRYAADTAPVQRARARDVGRADVLVASGLTVVGAGSFYLIFVFLPAHATRLLAIPGPRVQAALVVSALLNVGACLAGGWLSDRYGRRRLLVPSVLAYAVLCYPAFALVTAAPGFGTLLAAQAVTAVVVGLFSGAVPVTMSELFAARVRSSGVGIVYNLVGGIFGGLGPFFVTVMIALTGDRASPGYWALLTAAIGAAAILYPRRADRTDPRLATTAGGG